jgi:hypothetical protein
MVTTRGRLLRGFTVAFRDGEIHIAWVRLKPGEQVAVLLDRAHGQARVYAPLDICKELALQHGYELVVRRKQGETLVEHLERFLGLRNTAEPKEASDRAGHDERGGVADATECPGLDGGGPASCKLNPDPRPGAVAEAARQGAQGAGD